MTSVAEAETDLRAGGEAVTEAQLLDVLYEVLAQGVPAKGQLTTAAVEGFLHEHARGKKPLHEMLAFFTRYGLPTDPGAYGADPELGELASGLHRERGPISSLFGLDEATSPELPAPSESGPIKKALPSADEPRTGSFAAVAVSEPQSNPWLLACVALIGLGLLAGLFGSHQRGVALEGQLNQARLQQRSTDAALTVLEQRAETLRGSLDRTESERRDLSTRIEAFMVDEQQRRAAEQDALKRLLGPRYETLREKALTEASTPTIP